jgi:hypothetical protein
MLRMNQLVEKFRLAVQSIDIGNAEASVASDRKVILKDIQSAFPGGIPEFNRIMQVTYLHIY